MAKVLILQEEDAWQAALRRSLEDYHELSIVHTIEAAMHELHGAHFDLIICRVHLENENAFEFLKLIKGDKSVADVPVLCFSGLRTRHALMANGALAGSARILGADQYLSVEDYCSEKGCDLLALRQAIEQVMQFEGPDQ